MISSTFVYILLSKLILRHSWIDCFFWKLWCFCFYYLFSLLIQISRPEGAVPELALKKRSHFHTFQYLHFTKHIAGSGRGSPDERSKTRLQLQEKTQSADQQIVIQRNTGVLTVKNLRVQHSITKEIPPQYNTSLGMIIQRSGRCKTQQHDSATNTAKAMKNMRKAVVDSWL